MHCLCSAYAVSGPLITIIVNKLCYVRGHLGMHTDAENTLSSQGCTMCLSCYDADIFYVHRSPITAPWTQATVRLPRPASRWSHVRYDKKKSCRAGDSARMVERLQSWQRGGGARTDVILARRPWLNKRRPVVPMYLKENPTKCV